MTTTLDLLGALHTHLTEFDVPALASVHVATYGPEVTAQLDCRTPPEIAAALLAWVDTLTDPTAHAWRVLNGDRVHLSVVGLLADGAQVQVYGGVRFTAHGPGGRLDPGATTPVPLVALRHLAELGEVPA